jgi:hypothetical protein
MSQAVPFAESIGGKLANGSAALFLAGMAITGLQAESNDFSLLFITVTTLAICGFINSITLSLEDYPRECLFMMIVGPFIGGPLLAWTHVAGGGELWKPMVCGALALVFLFFLVKPPKFSI